MAQLYQQDLRGLVERINDLPSFPAAVQRATALADDPRASASDLAAVIEVDPALTARVLRVTNSAFYGLSRQISTVREGVVILGFSAVRSLAVAVCAMKMFKGNNSPWFNHEQFWLHSTCCAIIAHRLTGLSQRREPDETFTAALLHDVGKIVLDQYAHDDFMLLLATQKAQGMVDTSIELQMFSTSHAELGQKLCERWRLPSPLCESIGCHHSNNAPALPSKVMPASKAASGSRIGMISRVADYLCTVNGLPSIMGSWRPPPPANAIQALRLPSSTLEEISGQFTQIRNDARKLIEHC